VLLTPPSTKLPIIIMPQAKVIPDASFEGQTTVAIQNITQVKAEGDCGKIDSGKQQPAMIDSDATCKVSFRQDLSFNGGELVPKASSTNTDRSQDGKANIFTAVIRRVMGRGIGSKFSRKIALEHSLSASSKSSNGRTNPNKERHSSANFRSPPSPAVGKYSPPKHQNSDSTDSVPSKDLSKKRLTAILLATAFILITTSLASPFFVYDVSLSELEDRCNKHWAKRMPEAKSGKHETFVFFSTNNAIPTLVSLVSLTLWLWNSAATLPLVKLQRGCPAASWRWKRVISLNMVELGGLYFLTRFVLNFFSLLFNIYGVCEKSEFTGHVFFVLWGTAFYFGTMSSNVLLHALLYKRACSLLQTHVYRSPQMQSLKVLRIFLQLEAVYVIVLMTLAIIFLITKPIKFTHEYFMPAGFGLFVVFDALYTFHISHIFLAPLYRLAAAPVAPDHKENGGKGVNNDRRRFSRSEDRSKKLYLHFLRHTLCTTVAVVSSTVAFSFTVVGLHQFDILGTVPLALDSIINDLALVTMLQLWPACRGRPSHMFVTSPNFSLRGRVLQIRSSPAFPFRQKP